MDERELVRAVLAGREETSLTAGERNYLRVHGLRYRRTLALWPEGGGRRLLDVGCFPGHLALLAAAKGWRVSGLSTGGVRGGDPSFEKRMAGADIETRTLGVMVGVEEAGLRVQPCQEYDGQESGAEAGERR